MDAKDPSSVAAPATNDALFGDDGRIPEAVGLAKEAAFLFQSRRFGDCVDALIRLLHKKPDDPKVLHNIAVAEYFKDGCSNPRKLLDELNKVKVRTAELARASGEQTEVAGGTGNNAVVGSKVNNTLLPQLSSLNSGRTFYPDEFDTSVAVLNNAIVLFHLHEYAHALSVLEPLYQNIEPIDETTAIRVCLLLLDVSLSCRNATKAADVISYLERYFGVGQTSNQVDNANTASNLPNQLLKTSGASHASAPDASGPDSSGNTNVSDSSLTIALPDESLEYETLYSTLDSGHNLARPPSNDSSKLSSDQLASDMKLNLHLYKVRLLLLMRNPKAAKREIKLAMNVARSGDSSTALLLKSQLEFARGNHRKAFKLLTMSSNRTEPEMLSIFNNNMGCIYHQLGKHHTATVFFSKALKSGRSLWSEKPLKLASFSLDKSLVIVYNCGLQYLLCGKPLIAARCFDRARPVYYDRPILWLRFAECCLSALEKGLLKAAGATPSHEDIRVHVVGSGRWRHLVVNDINSRHKYFDCIEDDGLITADGQHRLSLPFARRCLLTALQLLDNNTPSISLHLNEEDGSKQTTISSTEAGNITLTTLPGIVNGDTKESRGTNSNTAFQNSLSAYEETCKKEKHMIKQAVLADLAYIELSLGNPGKALSYAKALLEFPECSRVYTFLSRVYVAEALCCLNRLEEAAEHLSVYLSENEVQVPYSEEDMVKWKIDPVAEGDESVAPLNSKTSATESQDTMFCKPAEARGILYVNLATMSALQGNLEQASRLVKEAQSVLPNSPRAMLAAIYVDLLSGRTQDALVKLKQCRHVKFFPPSVSSSST